MPLAQGKSQKSFEKNIKTEMHEGKPQKQALAIAYAVKKRMQKKAHGGVVEGPDELGRSYDKPGHQEGQDNDMLNPERSGGTGIRDQIYRDQRLSYQDQAYGQTPQPDQPGARYQPSRGTNPIRPEPTIGQAKFGPEAESQHLAAGGEVKAAMSRRDRALFAARGEHPSHHDLSQMGHAERYPGGSSSPNEGASRDTGPSGKTTRMPLTPGGVAAGPPSSDRISEEEQAMFAKGGPVAMADYHRGKADHYEKMAAGGMADPLNQAPALKEHEDEHEKSEAAQTGAGAMQSGMKDFIKGAGKGMKKMASGGMTHGDYGDPHLSEEEQSQFYDRGGIARSGAGGNQISSPRAPYKPLSPGYGKHPLAQAEEEGERFALGGYATGGAIAKRIREGKRMAMGGKVYDDDDRPEGAESIDNFRRESHPDNDFLSDEEQTSYRHLHPADEDEEAEAPARKGMLDRIMRGIHARNGNR